jgi:uncharacterized protein YacL
MTEEQKNKKEEEGTPLQNKKVSSKNPAFNPKLIGAITDEVSKTLMTLLPTMLTRQRKKTKSKKTKKIENAIFLDTSAIIDGRIFDVINLGLLYGVIVITASILLELKHIADSQNTVKRERGRKGLEWLEKLKKSKKMKVIILSDEEEKIIRKYKEVDERLIKITKIHKGKVITCDYNLEKKAIIENTTAVNVNALANCLKVIAVPGESLHLKVSHQGKDPSQGVGYLDDGTMLVVEGGSDMIGESIDVVVSRVIQTGMGRILFAKKI